MGETAPGPVPDDWAGHEPRRVIDEVGIIGIHTVSAAFFLIALGMLAAGSPLTGVPLFLALAGVGVDILAEAWVYLEPYRYGSDLVRRLIVYHYALIGLAYLVLGLTIADALPLFFGYPVFMLTWLAGFLVGEGMVAFIHD